jgi:hypothetical protein
MDERLRFVARLLDGEPAAEVVVLVVQVVAACRERSGQGRVNRDGQARRPR